MPGTVPIAFTQYLRPNGRRTRQFIERPPDIAALAAGIVAAGYHFDAEVLQTGHVSFTIEPNTKDANGEDAPIAWEIVPNGPAVLEAVDRLVRAAAALVLKEPT